MTRVLPAGGRSPIASAICCLAGAAAEARLVGIGYASACKVDVEDAKAYLIAANLSVSDIWPEALKLIDHYRELIELVAHTLIRSGELDGAQFQALVDPAAAGDRRGPLPFADRVPAWKTAVARLNHDAGEDTRVRDDPPSWLRRQTDIGRR